MATQFTLNEILGKAIQKEIGSRLLYIDLSQKMKDQVAKDAFQELAQQKQGHQNLLEQYLRGELKEGTLSKGWNFYAQKLHFPRLTVGKDSGNKRREFSNENRNSLLQHVWSYL